MEVIIDHRERQLIDALQKSDTTMTYRIETLDVGDILFRKNGAELLVVERKTLADLASSIRDGRYHEQGIRLANYPQENHNIVYLVEGTLSKYYPPPIIKNPITKSTLVSSMLSTMYFKGFSVLQTACLSETLFFMHAIYRKLEKEDKVGWYSGGKDSAPADYLSTIKTVKKNNVTPENIDSIMLSQIPDVSTTIAAHILDTYLSVYALTDALKADSSCLDDLKYSLANNKQRRISKKAIQNIKLYLKI